MAGLYHIGLQPPSRMVTGAAARLQGRHVTWLSPLLGLSSPGYHPYQAQLLGFKDGTKGLFRAEAVDINEAEAAWCLNAALTLTLTLTLALPLTPTPNPNPNPNP